MHANAPQPNVVIWCANDAPMVIQRARALAKSLALPIASDDDVHNADLLLIVTDDRLELREPSRLHRPGFTVDFADVASKRGRTHLSKRQPIARAFGKDVTTIVDATAGWGRDAFLLASLGYSVTAVERSPIVAALLRDGVARARVSEEKLKVLHGDARDVLRSIAPPPDAVYLDPMYPPKKKQSARSRKSVELLRMLVGRNDDARELFDAAMAVAGRRVVVKRADDAPPLAPNPAAQHTGKTVRYDVYLPKR